MKGKIQLINHQGDIARPLKIINGEFNTKMLKLKKKNTCKYRTCLCVAHKKLSQKTNSFTSDTSTNMCVLG